MKIFVPVTLLVLNLAFPFKCRAQTIDASDLEARFGCAKLSILADLVSITENRPGDRFCRGFNQAVDLMDAAQWNVERAIANTNFVDSEEDDIISGLRDQCLSSEIQTSGIRIELGDAIEFEDTIANFLTCRQTDYTCNFDRSISISIFGITVPLSDPLSNQLEERTNAIRADTVDFECLRELFTSVADIRESFMDQSSINGACQEQTVSLQTNEDLRAEFSEIEVSTSTQTVDRTMTEFVEYLVENSPTAYEGLCRSNGGTLVDINLRAVCRGFRFEIRCNPGCSRTVVFIRRDLVVTNRPRCYGIDCSSSDDMGLFQEYTLRETERLWEEQMPDRTWVCQGELVDGTDETFSICSQETAIIGEAEVLRSTSRGIVPEVQQKRGTFLFFWQVDLDGEKVVRYQNGTTEATTAYQEACTNNGGEFSVADDFVLQCERVRVGGGSRVDETLQFDISGLPVCASASCIGSEDSDDVEASIGAEQLVQTGALSSSDEFEWRCVHTSGASVALTPTILGSIIAAVACTMLV